MRRRLGSRGGKKAIPLVLIAVMLVLLAVVFFLLQSLKPEQRDQTTLCSEKTGITAGLIILLDLTDAITRTQHERLKQIIDKKINDAQVNTLIAVSAVRADLSERGVKFKRCKPRDGSRANELYENPRLIAETYSESFKQPLDEVLEKALAVEGAQQSPIMESLQATLAETPGFLHATYPRRVIIVSDLVQHSSVFSFYRRDNWRKFSRSSDYRRLARNLKDVDIEIWYLPRAKIQIDVSEVDDFWVNYFEQSGAHSVRTLPLGDL